MRSDREQYNCSVTADPAADELQRLTADASPHSPLKGKRVGVLLFSQYPYDSRPRRAAEAFAKEGMKVDVVCIRNDGAPRREVCNGVDVTRLPIRRIRNVKVAYLWQYSVFIAASALTLAARSLSHRYDLIHVHNMPDVLVFSAVVPKALGAKIILDMHDPMPELMQSIFKRDKASPVCRILQILERLSIGFADKVIAVNAACKQLFSSRSCRPEKVCVVMNSPEAEVFHFHAPEPRSLETTSCDQPFVIIYHGSLVERNGLNVAVSALQRVRQEIPRVELRIFGEPSSFLSSVMSSVRERGLADVVHFLGPRRFQDLPSEIAKCDVGIIPNQRNAFTDINTPTRIFEYLALGKPVIVPRTRGVRDYFDDDSLIFFEAGNADELARQIAYVASHPVETTRIVEQGQRVYRAHTWTAEKRNLLALAADMLA